MDFLAHVYNIIIHFDHYLLTFVNDYGTWTYLLLFLVIFCETGLVITPFLPGDSLLFIAGTIASHAVLNVHWLVILLIIAAILGDTVNYWLGNKIGRSLLQCEKRILIKHKHIEYTQQFYQRHGGKTIIIARFVPIVRTFAPFVAGIGSMHYAKFLLYNIIGAISWVALFTYAGFFFGNIPVFKENFTLVIFAIIFLSLLPPLFEFARHHLQKTTRNSNKQTSKNDLK